MYLNEPGPDSFLQLSDTPDSYFGFGNDVVSVKVTEDGLNFTVGGGGGMTKLTLVSGAMNQGVFVWSAPPKLIIVDQARTIDEGNGYSLSGSTSTLDIYPTFSITAFG